MPTDPTEAPVERARIVEHIEARIAASKMDSPSVHLSRPAWRIVLDALAFRPTAAPACDDDVAEQWRERVDAEVRPLFDVDEHGDWSFRDSERLDPVGAVVDRALRALTPEIARLRTQAVTLASHNDCLQGEVARLTAERDEAGGDYDRGYLAGRSAGEGQRHALEATNIRLLARAERAEAALREIAAGDGYYGAQAREYKDIARRALSAAPQGWKPPVETCPKCGARGVAFICDAAGCPMNGGAARAALSSPPASPTEEWVLVPREPTREMCNAYSVAEAHSWTVDSSDDPLDHFAVGYRAMLSAASPASRPASAEEINLNANAGKGLRAENSPEGIGP